jgi:hypothetical protein
LGQLVTLPNRVLEIGGLQDLRFLTALGLRQKIHTLAVAGTLNFDSRSLTGPDSCCILVEIPREIGKSTVVRSFSPIVILSSLLLVLIIDKEP